MADGRKNNGGKRSNAGRKSRAEELGLQRLLEECFIEADRRACIKALVARTRPGKNFSMEAVKLLFAYAYGKPVEGQELTGADGGQVEVNLIIEGMIDKVYGDGDSKANKQR